MSKLVIKSINDIINKKFIGEKRILSPEEIANAKKQANKLDQSAFDNLGKSNEMKTAITQSQLSDLEKKKEKLENQKKRTSEQERQNLSQGNERQQDENFDAQAVPRMPPIGMPPTAAPAPPPAPTGAPNYEGGHMTKTQLCQVHEACSNLMASIEDYDSLPDWVKGKITLAADYLVKCESFVNAKDQEHEDSQKDNHMPPTAPAVRPPMPPTSSPSAGGSPMMGISLGKIQSVSPGE